MQTYENVALGLLSTVLGEEWGVPVEALVQNDANALLVASPIVFTPSTGLNDLGCHVLAGADYRVGRGTIAAPVPPPKQMGQVGSLGDVLLLVPLQRLFHRLEPRELSRDILALLLIFRIAIDIDAQSPQQGVPLTVVV